MRMVLPELDLILHNLVALVAAVVALMIGAQLVLAALLRATDFVLHAPLFGEGREARAAAVRKRLKRTALLAVALVAGLLLVGDAVLSLMGIRALGVVQHWLGQMRHEDLSAIGARAAWAVGVLVLGWVASALARAGVEALEKAASHWSRRQENGEKLAVVLARLQLALRVAIVCATVVLVCSALGIPDRVFALGSDVLVSFYGCRFLAAAAHLGVDLLFAMSGKLTKLESPLKYLGSLSHLKGITQRAIDYLVYVAAVTWVADQFTPDTWLSRAGRIGIRVVAIFYASRVLIEVCLLFIHEIFVVKTAGHTSAEIQQRRTLVPVAVGLLRYGIYFSALVMVLREAAIDPTPLLAGAGVLGVAVGFGAQAFVGDIVAGFFILFENVLLVGDQVEVGGVSGTVEEIGVRITKIRDDAGVLHAIPNGEVRRVANHSKSYVNAVAMVYVPYDEDLPRVRALLAEITQEVLAHEDGARVPVEVSVHELLQNHALLRVSGRVAPGTDQDVAARLRERIIDELRTAGVVSSQGRPELVPKQSARLQVARPVLPPASEVPESAATLFKPAGD